MHGLGSTRAVQRGQGGGASTKCWGKKTSKALRRKFGPSGPCNKGSEWAESKGGGPQRREKKESGEVGRLGQNRLEKEEWPRVDIKNRNPFIFSKHFF
jgi:hypothetical protein